MDRKAMEDKAVGLIIIMFLCSVAYCVYYIAFHDYALNPNNRYYDFIAHTQFAEFIKVDIRSTVYPILYSAINYFARKFDYNTSMSIVTATASTISIFIVFLILVKMKLKYTSAALLSPLFMVVCSIYNYQTTQIYMGTWTPNPYHNPTYLVLRPFVLIFILLLLMIFNNKPDIVSGYKNTRDNICWILASVFLFLSGLAKPSFIQVFLPTYFVFMFIYMFKNKLSIKNKLIFMAKSAILALPAVFLFANQYYLMMVKHIGYLDDSGTKIGLDGYNLLKSVLNGRDVAFAILCMCAFPLAVTILNFRKAIKDDFFILFWGIYSCSIVQCFLISEVGKNKNSFNIVWGYEIASFLLILYSAIFAIKNFQMPTSNKLTSQAFWWMRTVIPIGLFGLHLATGIYCLINVFIGHTYLL